MSKRSAVGDAFGGAVLVGEADGLLPPKLAMGSESTNSKFLADDVLRELGKLEGMEMGEVTGSLFAHSPDAGEWGLGEGGLDLGLGLQQGGAMGFLGLVTRQLGEGFGGSNAD